MSCVLNMQLAWAEAHKKLHRKGATRGECFRAGFRAGYQDAITDCAAEEPMEHAREVPPNFVKMDIHTCSPSCPCHTGGKPTPDFIGRPDAYFNYDDV